MYILSVGSKCHGETRLGKGVLGSGAVGGVAIYKGLYEKASLLR